MTALRSRDLIEIPFNPIVQHRGNTHSLFQDTPEGPESILIPQREIIGQYQDIQAELFRPCSQGFNRHIAGTGGAMDMERRQ